MVTEAFHMCNKLKRHIVEGHIEAMVQIPSKKTRQLVMLIAQLLEMLVELTDGLMIPPILQRDTQQTMARVDALFGQEHVNQFNRSLVVIQ
jgi:transcriptional regulator of NAD metabolism